MEISVVLVTCNRPLYIFERAYNSVCSQTHPPKEFIIVNAGLTTLPRSCMGQIVIAPGVNGSEARNIGAKYTTSDFIAFLDDDDEWQPNHLYSHLQLLDDAIGLVYTERTDKGEWDLKESNIFVRNYVGPTSFVTVSRRFFELVNGFDESFASNQEWDLWIRIMNNAPAVKCCSNTAIKHHSSDSISTNTKKRIAGWESLLKKYHAVYMGDPVSFRKVTKIFLDEMYLKHSLAGVFRAIIWNVRSWICTIRQGLLFRLHIIQ